MQAVAGIIAEYNPFHAGHQYHIAETRRIVGSDCGVVCVQSGDFVQRGDCAVFDKFTRAEMAVRGGADLVLELPVRWSLASAEGFANAGVSLLQATGVVTHLSFGSESGDLERLRAAARALNDPAFSDALRAAMKTGLSYPAAAQAAARALTGDDAGVLAQPNDTLAVQYLRALEKTNSAILPAAVRRLGAGHDAAGESEYPSGAELRARLRAGTDVSGWVPNLPAVQPVFLDDLEIAILSRLRALPPAAFRDLPDAAEGLDNVLYRAVHTEATLGGVLAAAKSKRYPLSRLRRMLLCAALGIQKTAAPPAPTALRVLAANERGRALLHTMRKTASLPVITKPSDGKDDPECRLTAAAHDFYVLALPDRSPGQDWRKTPEML